MEEELQEEEFLGVAEWLNKREFLLELYQQMAPFTCQKERKKKNPSRGIQCDIKHRQMSQDC